MSSKLFGSIILSLLFCVWLSANPLPEYPPQENHNSKIVFEGETLEFCLSPEGDYSLWKLSGDYYFSNFGDSEVNELIWFPIPLDEEMGQARNVHVELADSVSNAAVQIVRISSGGLYFSLSVPGKTFVKVKIAYEQLLRGNRAAYILTTANAWGNALSFAKYQLRVNAPIVVNKLPFEVQKLHRTETYLEYSWSFDDFHPPNDFEVIFER